MNIPVATRITKERNRALEYLAAVRGTSKAALIESALIEQYDLDNLSAQAEKFFAERAQFIEDFRQQVGVQ